MLENNARAYQIADDTDSASSAAVGVTLAFFNINNMTDGFIGNPGTASTYSPGAVDATGNVSVTANTLECLMAVSASSVANSNSTSNGAASGTSASPSSGSMNGTSNTSDKNPVTSTSSYTNSATTGSGNGFAVSGDIAFNNVTDHTNGYISDGATINSLATLVPAQHQRHSRRWIPLLFAVQSSSGGSAGNSATRRGAR